MEETTQTTEATVPAAPAAAEPATPATAAATPAAAEPAKPAEAAKPAPQQYTDADIQARIEAERQKWSAEQEKQAQLNKLPPEDRAKAETAAKDTELADLRAQLLRRDLKEEAVAALSKSGIPAGMADALDYTDKAHMEASLERTRSLFQASLDAAVSEKLKGKTPEGLAGAPNADAAIKEQIARNIRGGM